MNTKIALPLGILVAGAVTISVLVIAKPKPTPQIPEELPKHASVTVTTATSETVRLAVTSQGSVVPKRQIDIVAQVSGEIVTVSPAFNSGGFFTANDALLSIDSRDYQTALLNAQSQLAQAQRRLAEEQGLSRQAQREWRDLGNQAANDLFIRKPQLTAATAASRHLSV